MLSLFIFFSNGIAAQWDISISYAAHSIKGLDISGLDASLSSSEPARLDWWDGKWRNYTTDSLWHLQQGTWCSQLLTYAPLLDRQRKAGQVLVALRQVCGQNCGIETSDVLDLQIISLLAVIGEMMALPKCDPRKSKWLFHHNSYTILPLLLYFVCWASRDNLWQPIIPDFMKEHTLLCLTKIIICLYLVERDSR